MRKILGVYSSSRPHWVAETARDGQLVLLDGRSGDVLLEASTDAILLVLSGEPLDEPVVAYGPFVMNTLEEIQQAQADFMSGRFGQLAT